MKKEKNMELFRLNLKNRKPFKVIYGGDDDGIYFYDKSKNRYQGEIGYIDLEGMLEAIKHMEQKEDWHIVLELIKNE